MPQLEFVDVQCSFNRADGKIVRAIDRVSASVEQGEFVCLVGRSGHGKSTLLRALAGLQPLNSGRISIEGRSIVGPGSDRGMVFQNDTVFPWLSVLDNVAFGLKAKGMPKDERERIASQWIAAVGLSGYEKSWPKELSGGMRKRVAIATTFANDCSVFLMDEPFGPLDYVTRRELQDLLLRLWRDTGKTVMFVTHDIEEALILADRVLIIHTGRVVDDIKVGLERPRSEEVRAQPEAVRITRTIQQKLQLVS